MSDNQARMLEYLFRSPAAVTAAELADRLGVTPRSVRSYINRVKSAAAPLVVIEAGPAGYRLNREAYGEFLASTTARSGRSTGSPEAETPQDRLYHLVRRLIDVSDDVSGGLDVYELASALFVSDSTIESDLGRVRSLLADTPLSLQRQGSRVSVIGPEPDQRRLLSRIFREGRTQGILDLEAVRSEFAAESIGAFKTDLIAILDAQGYFVNEFGTDSVLLHLAIAVDRVTRHPATELPSGPASPPARPNLSSSATISPTPAADPLPHDPPTLDDSPTAVNSPHSPADIVTALKILVARHFQVELGADDIDYLAFMLTTRVVTPGHDESAESLVAGYVRPDDLATVRRIVRRASEEYLVDLNDDDFIVRLTLHVHNLIERAHDNSYSRNPLTRSIKSAYPLIYELAVYLSSELQRETDIQVNDDEIAYIAMHVGALFEQQSRREVLVSCALVCPNYYDMHVLLRERIERVFADDLEVVRVVTRSDADWGSLDTDIVLTTIVPPVVSDRVVVIQPFLTSGDIEQIRTIVARVRRQRRRSQISADLRRFFNESLFMRNVYASDEIAMIRLLGERMIEQGIIGPSYVEAAIERERLSSTAFTDNLAVPHAMAMTATRTSIAIVVNDTPMDWGDNRVNLVALIAFNESERASFQGVFDQFVEVFAERSDVQQLIKRSVDYPSFIEELAHLIDS